MDGITLGALIVVVFGLVIALYVHFITNKRNDEERT